MNPEKLCTECIDKEDLKAKVKELSKLIHNETVQVVSDFGYLLIEDGISECEIFYDETDLRILVKRYPETMRPSYKNSTIDIKIDHIHSIDIHSEEFEDGFKILATIYLEDLDSSVTFYLVKEDIDIEDFDDEIYKFAKKIYDMENDSIINWHINDGYDSYVAMGLKKLQMFDCSLVISSAYNGGLESILWMSKDIKPIDICKWLKSSYKNL